MERRLRWRMASTWLGLSFALLMATGAQGFRALHGFLVPHRLCAVHGEWEHLPEGASSEHASSGGLETSDEARPSLSYLVPDAPHSTCSLGILAREGHSLTVSERPHHGLAPGIHAPEIASSETPHSSVPLLSLAPKHSPPA